MIVYYILCPSLRVVIFREEQGLSTFYMRCDVRKKCCLLYYLSQFVVCGVVVIVDGGKILVETKQGLQLHFLAFGLTTFEPLHGDATRINIDARNNSRMDAT